MRHLLRVTAVATMLSFSGCYTATIHRARGPAYEAEIVSSDAESLHVRGDDNLLHPVPRSEVRDVDHPGNVAMVVGAALAAFIAVFVFDGGESKETKTTIGVVYGIPAAMLLGMGGHAYVSSRLNSTSTARPRRSPAPAPTGDPWAPAPAPPPAPPAPPPAEEPQVIPAPAEGAPKPE